MDGWMDGPSLISHYPYYYYYYYFYYYYFYYYYLYYFFFYYYFYCFYYYYYSYNTITLARSSYSTTASLIEPSTTHITPPALY